MGVEVLTVEELEQFRLRLFEDIEKLIVANKPRRWLKTHEVIEMLGISESTLLGLRKKGLIPFRKLANKCYYNAEEIDEAMRKSGSLQVHVPDVRPSFPINNYFIP